ncbi:hypothetical protein EJ04DRAFT_506554 [Polyplosphaeria fusca]|uniref:Uncharacterized protein n=1 Tax=Polyplosphaeria fusca TaxID=682080 RepID=A0A9P4QJJ6_9PLEO|nr:hypothetical protein EJ04DRAFT_506554 [Polyplosphaeria fusca]
MPFYQDHLDPHFARMREDISASGEEALDGIIEQLAMLQEQATVQKTLVSTAHILRSHPKERALPNQLAKRVKHLLNFIFKESSRNETRSMRLRKTDCNAVKFCGLAYTINDLLKLSEAAFEILVSSVTQFVQDRGLIQYLYREDIEKMLSKDIAPENEQLYRDFLMASVTSRPLKRPSVVDKDESGASDGRSGPTPPKKRREDVLDTTSSAELATQTSSCQTPHSELKGAVFDLTVNDVTEMVRSDQIGSAIFLTWPFHLRFAPFVTIPISNSLALEMACKCSPPQQMT